MLERLRSQFGAVGLAVAVIALVFAMAGGAYAAKKYVITSTGQIKPSVLKSLQGKAGSAGVKGDTGPAGATGLTGAKGDKGDTGAAGSNGTNGINGTLGPEGPEGSPWTASGTLPPEATETGVWGTYGSQAGTTKQVFPISFTLPLSEEPEAIFVDEGELSKPGCPGIVDGVPAADPGKLCVYGDAFEEATNDGFFKSSPGVPFGSEEPGVGATGTRFKVTCEAFCFAAGTWAVTGPEE